MTIAFENRVRGNSDRLFFTGMAVASAVTVLVGFAPSYFLRGNEMPALTALYHVHGLVFTAWILLFIVQSSLVSAHRTDLHRSLGVAGGFVAAAVFALGIAVSIETLRRQGGSVGRDPRQFFAIPIGDILVFGALVTAAILLRRRSDWHKRLMMLATISILTAAIARFLNYTGHGSQYGLFIGTDLFVLAVIVYDFYARGRLHPATLWGAGGVVVFKPILFLLSGTSAWLELADALRGA